MFFRKTVIHYIGNGTVIAAIAVICGLILIVVIIIMGILLLICKSKFTLCLLINEYKRNRCTRYSLVIIFHVTDFRKQRLEQPIQDQPGIATLLLICLCDMCIYVGVVCL